MRATARTRAPVGPADAREITRFASDLARLRGLPAAGRGELVEAVQTVLAQGEPYGRGRAVARALEQVLVGTRHGRPAPGAPRSGLTPAVEAELSALGLPGPDPAQTDTTGPAGGRSGEGGGGRSTGPGARGPPRICGSTPCGPTSTGAAICCCAA